MNTFEFALDLSKQTAMEPLRLRQGDKNGTEVRATIYDHGTLVTGSYTSRICLSLPDGEHYYRKAGTFSAGVATVTIDEQQAASVVGRSYGYIQLLSGSTVIASTASFPVLVLPDATADATVPESYDTAIQEAIDGLNDAVADLPDTVEDVLADHPEWTTTVQDNSVTDAKLVQSGGILSRNQRLMYRLANLLTNRTDEGTLAAISDAAKTPMAGLSVYGQSTQDGTPTPESPVPIESVESANLLPGNTQTVVSTGNASIYPATLVNLPAGTYTVSFETEMTSGNWQAIYNSSESSTGQTVITTQPLTTKTVTFTVNVPMPYFKIYSMAAGTYKNIRLVRGSTAYPYVPYDHAGLWARGRNVAHPIAGEYSNRGITANVAEDGWITISGTSTTTSSAVILLGVGTTENTVRVIEGAPSFALYIENEGGLVSGEVELQVYGSDGEATNKSGYATASRTLTMFTDYISRIVVFLRAASNGKTYSGRFRFSLVRSDQIPTAYIPYVETVTPIPLDGHELRSLPDGTRDELTVDAEGHVTLVQRVGAVTFDGSENWLAASASGVFNLALWNQDAGTLIPASQQSGLCDRLTWDSAGVASMADGTFKVGSSGTSEYAFIVNKDYTTATEIKAWLAENTTTITYKLPPDGYVTHDLGTVPLVPLVGPDLTAQTVPTAPFVLDAERDLNVTLARLESAIAALA